MKKILNLLLIAFAAIAVPSSNAAAEDAYPSKPIQVFVGFPPGGVIDVVARKLVDEVRKKEGWQFVVVNRPGAGTTLAPVKVASSPPDGYTIGMGATTVFTVAPFSMEAYPRELLDKIDHLLTVGQTRTALVVKADSPYQSFRELVEAARKSPGKIAIGTTGLGTQLHVLIEAYARRENIPFTLVPFNGTPPGVTALLGGHVAGLLAATGPVTGSIETKSLRVLAATEKERLHIAPNAPTLIEQGVPFAATSMVEVFAPVGLPEAMAKRLTEVFSAASKTPSYLEMIKGAGTDNDKPMTGKTLRDFLAKDRETNEAFTKGR